MSESLVGNIGLSPSHRDQLSPRLYYVLVTVVESVRHAPRADAKDNG